MDSFWDQSWMKIDPDRLSEYIDKFDMKPDAEIEYLLSQNVRTVCDAGCGCGIYSLKLAVNGFKVSGFDVSAHAVEIARSLLARASQKAELKVASILDTGYEDGLFDCVICRDVVDHMRRADGLAAIQELYRIAKPGGSVLITVDHLDAEYESEPHTVNSDGDFIFTDGKWKGMVFHPYAKQELIQGAPSGAICRIDSGEDGIMAIFKKPI